jgi:hypothetical protein
LRRTALLLLALALGPSACGGDEEPAQQGTGTTDTAAQTETERPQATVTSPGPAPEATAPEDSPEDQPGGAGDEVPARSLAQFTGSAGRITPRLVRVPPYISIRVELRSADGEAYELSVAGRSIRVGSAVASASTVLDGLRPGAAYTLRSAAGRRVRVEASAEPGP